MNESTHLNNALKQAMASLKLLKFDDFINNKNVSHTQITPTELSSIT